VAIRCVFSSSKYSKTRFWPGLGPGTRWGSLRRSPDPLVGWGGGHPVPIPFPSTPSACRSRRFRRLGCQAPNTNSWLYAYGFFVLQKLSNTAGVIGQSNRTILVTRVGASFWYTFLVQVSCACGTPVTPKKLPRLICFCIFF